MREEIKKLETELAALETAEASESKVDLLNELAWELGFDEVHRAFELSKKAHLLARKISYKKGMARSLLNQAVYRYYVAGFELALDLAGDAHRLFLEIGDRVGEGDVLNSYGLVYWGLGDYEKALEHMHRALQIYREAGFQRGESWALTSMGGLYQSTGDYASALRHHQESLETFRNLGYKIGEARALSGIGTVFQSQGDYERALECHSQCLGVFREFSNKLGESRALNDIGAIHQIQDNCDKALECHNEALRLRREIGNKRAEPTSLLNLGRLHNQMGKPGKALDYLNQALSLTRETDEKPKAYQAHQALSHSFELLSDPHQALDHYKTFHQLEEEVFSHESNTRLKNLEIRYEVEKAEKEAEIQRLRTVELAQALERLKAAQTQLIHSEKMAALGKLISGVAHEVNTPTGAIGASIDVSKRVVEKIHHELNRSDTVEEANDALERYIGVLRDTNETAGAAVKRITKLIESLKSFARLDEAEFQHEVDIHAGIEAALALIGPELGDRVEVVEKFGDIPKIEGYPSQLNQLFMILLLNACESIDGSGWITVVTRPNQDHVVMKFPIPGGVSPPTGWRQYSMSASARRKRVCGCTPVWQAATPPSNGTRGKSRSKASSEKAQPSELDYL